MAGNVNGFILAGGRSSRMGRDKALLDWHGRTLLAHMVDLLQAATDQVQVVGRDRLPDRLPGLGPLSGIATALANSSSEVNLIVAVDLPLLTKDFLIFLRSRAENSKCPVLACKIESHFPLCLGIRRSLLPEIEKRLSEGHLSVYRFIEDSGAEIISGLEPSLFRNINTPEDYEEIS
jgi:molybdenum cofactor guanylyltransferase